MTDKTFLGMVVEGEVYVPHHARSEQLSEEEVNNLFKAVIDRPEVLGIGWTQYTPYFNDGEPCVFRTCEPYLAIEGAVVEGERYFDYDWQEDDYEQTGRVWLGTYESEFHRLVGERKYDWSSGKSVVTEHKVNEPLFDAVYAFFNAMSGGQMNDVLLKKFGDHAQVVIDTKAGKVIVDDYDHE